MAQAILCLLATPMMRPFFPSSNIVFNSPRLNSELALYGPFVSCGTIQESVELMICWLIGDLRPLSDRQMRVSRVSQ